MRGSGYGRAHASDPNTLLHQFLGFTADEHVLRYTAPAPQDLRFVRVETASSCSWVGWREIEIYGLRLLRFVARVTPR